MHNLDGYEYGMRCLLRRLGRNHPRYSEALTLQSRLQENVGQALQYGDTDASRAGRAQIVDGLNRLALDVLRTSFNELCEQERAQPIPHVEEQQEGNSSQPGSTNIPYLASLPACPFVAGPKITDPRLFVGRKDEIHRLVNAMAGAVPISINVVGERRIGKSSLLYHFYQTWQQRVWTAGRYIVTYLSLQEAAAQSEVGFYHTLAWALLARSQVQQHTSLVEMLNRRPLQRDQFAGAVKAFQSEGLLPVFCLDEFESLLKYPGQFNDGFYDALRALMDNHALMLIVASLRPLDVYRRQHRLTSSFFNVGQLLALGELTEDEAIDLVRLPASTVPGMPAALGLEEQRLARAWGGRHPCLLQLAASFLYQARQDGKDAAWAAERFEIEARRVPRSRLRRLWRPLRWLAWDLPAGVGRLARGIGGTVDEVSNWIIGMVVLIVVALALLGLLTQTQALDLLRQALGR